MANKPLGTADDRIALHRSRTKAMTKQDARILLSGLLADGLDVHQLTKTGRQELRDAIDLVLNNAADALSRLTTPPLPDEVAEIVGGLEAMHNAPIAPGYRSIAKRSATTLIALALENAKQHNELTLRHGVRDTIARKNLELEQRIRELEAEQKEKT